MCVTLSYTYLAYVSIIAMANEKRVRVSEETLTRLHKYKDEYGHSSLDSAIRESINYSIAWQERGSDVL